MVALRARTALEACHLLVGIVGLSLLSACGFSFTEKSVTSDATTTTASAESPTTSTTPPQLSTTTDSEAATATTTIVGSTSTEPGTDELNPAAPGFPAVEPTSGGAHGSGCAPGPGDLPDGVWFGFVSAWTPSTIEFDLACFYTGESAATEAAARGEESPPPNDYIIVNDNPTIRTVAAATDATGRLLDPTLGLELGDQVDYAELVTYVLADPASYPCPDQWCLIWLYVVDGEAVQIVEQYVP